MSNSAEGNHSRTSLSVAVGSPHDLTVVGIASILAESGYEVIGTADTVADLIRLVDEERPHVIFVDHSMLGEDMSTVRQLAVSGGIIAVIADPALDGDVANRAVQAGARGYLSINDPPLQFLDSVRLLFHGAIVISSGFGQVMWSSGRAAESGTTLNEAQRQLAVLIARGASNREIASQMYISEHTVKVRIGQMLAKLNLRNRQQIAVYAAQNGLLEVTRVGEPAG